MIKVDKFRLMQLINILDEKKGGNNNEIQC